MQATLFDSSGLRPCSVAEATAAVQSVGVTWIDVRLDSATSTDGDALLAAIGADAGALRASLQHGLGTDFAVTPTSVSGIAWLNDPGEPCVQAAFDWNEHRLVTVRTGGDAAIEQVAGWLQDRSNVVIQHPSTVLGVVLQLMLTTVQRALTQVAVGVGTIDLQIIDATSPQPQLSQQLGALRASFQPVAARFPMYQINVAAALIDPASVAGMEQEGLSELQQFQNAVQSTLGLISSLTGGIRDATQDYQALISTWQGARINVLTIVTMIFLPITFLTGYFGMNFTWLDDQLNSWASWFILGLLLPILLVVVSSLALASGGYTMPRLIRRRKPRTAPPPSA